MQKYLIVVLGGFIISLLLLTGCIEEQDKAPPKPSSLIQYKVLNIKDISYAGCKRMVTRVVLEVSGKPMRADMVQVAKYLWSRKGEGCDEFTVLMFLPEMGASSSAYGIAEFAPTGMTELKISKYMEPSTNTPEEKKRRKISYELVSAQDRLGTEAGDKYIMKRYGLTEDELLNIKVEGVKKGWPMPPPPEESEIVSPRPPSTPKPSKVVPEPPKARTPEERAKSKLSLARNYLRFDRKDKARGILESIIKDYPGTSSAEEAKGELERLK